MEKLICIIESLIMSLDSEDISMNDMDTSNELNKIENTELNNRTKKIKIMDDNLYINELTEKITHIIKSSNKNEFIKKYNECHNQIKQIDEILYSPNKLDPDIDIKILFEMLKKYDVLIEKGDITVCEYKAMCDVIEVIDNKMKILSMDVKEV